LGFCFANFWGWEAPAGSAQFSFLIDLFSKKGRGFGQRPKKRHFLFAKPFLLGL
jgi:hypothetical protein